MKSLNVATFAELPFIPRFNQKHFTEILHDPIEVFLMAERMESVVCISVLLQTHKYSDSVTYPSFLCGFNSTSVWSGADRICHCIRAVRMVRRLNEPVNRRNQILTLVAVLPIKAWKLGNLLSSTTIRNL